MTLMRQPTLADAKLLQGLDPIVAEAFAFGKRKHFKQVRKYSGEPYFWHPIQVASLAVTQTLDLSPTSQTRVAIAGLLHDTVEDTDTKFDEIAKLFGDQAATDVFWLTCPVEKAQANREWRQRLYHQQLSAAPMLIQGVKICDCHTNMSSILEHDPKFAISYAKEKAATVAAIDSSQLGANKQFAYSYERLTWVIAAALVSNNPQIR